MKIRLIASFFVLLLYNNTLAEINQRNLRSVRVYSTVLKEYRELQVFVPSEYDSTYYTYPAIYLLDSEKNFSTGVEVLSFMMDNHFIPPHVIIGIPNTDRFRDMTPVDSVMNKNIFPTRGGADNFLKALEMDIFPFVKHHFRLNSQRLLMGHNYSGLFVVYTFITRNDLFDRYLAFSPILWWNNDAIVGDMRKFLRSKSTLRNHFFVSFAKEANNMLEACKELISIMEEDAPDDLHWNYEWMPDEDHYSLYRKSLMKGMDNMFQDYKYPNVQKLVTEGIEGVKSYQRKVLLNYGRNEKLPFSLLESVCLELKNNGSVNDALRFLNYTLLVYPGKAETYFYVGEIYEQENMIQKAFQFYEIAHNKDKGRWDYEQKYISVHKRLNEMNNEQANQTNL
ncbi:alpha/beta hydrolase [Ancylomarina longa]|uniref:Alpha/beta hydrolase n=1 Tax=Ancylomarina longa TaxID=2487017 RepID=A0A434AGV0_9BACT|nr:alpha/beta hydrolase-fold protein [Ancylomarina longa]RUT73639.1 alpha/beta hydrolase [Ancylomarina longa]